MKHTFTYLFLLTALCFLQCTHRYHVTYDIPDYYPEARKQQIIEAFNRGKDLFKENCSGCHGIFTKGREQVPDFTYDQLDNYSARFLNSDPKNHVSAKKLEPDQLSEVLLFLRFKKANRKDTTAASKK